ncbi:NF-kappa-B inhibitor beta-like [Sycon ciliatum]|uniref:NF-kappa-B inhibitor beta-like n=1 Tax=Sycon ciliatum TaxID=27933 RepID=UPI0020ABDAC9|eukprot:scpid38930/ scgid6610/ Serine/threonine-protein phosphatase 6 regulatory ankyrin repeat subunit A; Ankyrin repeat domain-containing protein 28; Phosphatase interactor targeting protein hnRNP K
MAQLPAEANIGKFHEVIVSGDIQELIRQMRGKDKALIATSVCGNGHTPLELASFWGHLEIMKLLIAEGADVDEQSPVSGNTPLHSAALQNHARVVKYLLFNCDPAACMDITDNAGRTAADYAMVSDALWPFFQAAGYKGVRRPKGELVALGIAFPTHDELEEEERSSSGPGPHDSETGQEHFYRARYFGDVLQGEPSSDDGEEDAEDEHRT